MEINPKNKLKVWGTREGSLNMVYPWVPALVFELERYFGKGYNHQLAYFKGELFYWCEDFDGLRELAGLVLGRCLKDETYLSKVHSDWKKGTQEFFAETKTLAKMHLKEKSNQELLKINKSIAKSNNKIIKGYITDVMQMYLMDDMKKRLQEYVPFLDPKFNTYYAILTSPVNLSIAAKEEVEILNIAKAPLSKRKDLIKKHTEKYFWLGGNYVGRTCFDENYFTEKLKQVLKKSRVQIDKAIEKKKLSPVKAKKEKAKAIKDLKLDKEFQKVIKILEKVADFHDERKESLVAPVYYRIPLKNEIAKRLSITRYRMNWLTPKEVAEALERGKLSQEDRKKIQSRSKKCALYSSKQGTLLVSGKEAEELFNKVAEKEESSEIKGTVANPGKAKGVVKVLCSPKDVIKMERGDILVTGMTTPDYVPAMRLASAVVTDEGGITCHAAIISREIGIPCIIGTKSATQILKDGDIVEVDAEKGIVKISDQ